MAKNYRKIFQTVFDRLGFKPTKTFREGPRFYVIGGEYRGEKVIFKADLEASAKRLPKARLRLRREGIFLRHARIEHVPKFYARGVEGEIFWLLEEWVPGESQELGDSTFLIKDSFFTEQNLKFSLEFLIELHRLSEKPQLEFEKHFSRYNLADYGNLIWVDRDHTLGKPLAIKVHAFLQKRHQLFNKNQTVVTHHELYGPHIFVNKGEMNVIDWENVGWGNPAHDFVELWIRSFAHRDFQREFFECFRASQKNKEVFDELFRIEAILQGIGNMNHFKLTELEEEKKVAKEFSEFVMGEIEKAVADAKI